MPNGIEEQLKIPTPSTTPEFILPEEQVKAPDSTTAEKTFPTTIITPEDAETDFKKKEAEVKEIETGMEEQKKVVDEQLGFRPDISIVDYLGSKGQPATFSDRAKLAEQYGIANYTGTADQNTRLISILQAQPEAPVLTEEEKKKKDLLAEVGKEEPTAPTEPTEPTEPVETPLDAFTTAMEEQANKIDTAYEDYKSQMSKLTTGEIPLTPTEQAQINDINRRFDEIKAMQMTANRNFEEGTKIAGIVAGRQRYAPEIHMGEIKEAVDSGIKEISKIETKRLSAIAELKSAIQEKNYTLINDAYDRYRQYTEDKRNTLQGVYDAVEKAQDKIDKENEKIENALLKEKEKIETEKNKIISNAAKSGAPADVIAAIGGAESVADAVNAAGKYLETGAGIVGEYLFYKREQEAQGLTPIDFNTYQNIDANRKAKAQANAVAGQDLTTKEQAVFNRIVDKYNASPLVKAADRTLALKTISGALQQDKSNAANQVAFIYALIQALDNYQSAVREGEIRLVEETQGVMDKIQNLPDKIQKGSVMGKNVVDRYIKVASLLTNAMESAANKKTKEFKAQAITNSKRIGDAFTSYIGAVQETNNEDMAMEKQLTDPLGLDIPEESEVDPLGIF